MSEEKTTYQTGEVMLFVTLSEHLDRLRAAETEKPPMHRREVPSLTEIARATGLHRVTVTNLANNNVTQISRETLGKIVSELRRRGFTTNIQDVIALYPVENQETT